MQVPLYRAKAEFFRVLGHPVRIRVLELLCEGPKPVRELLADTEIESVTVTASSLSQQLAVLRRYGIVTTTREGGGVVYALAGPDVSDLMMAARRILTEMHAGRHQVFQQLSDAGGGVAPTVPGQAGNVTATQATATQTAPHRRLRGARNG